MKLGTFTTGKKGCEHNLKQRKKKTCKKISFQKIAIKFKI